MVVGELLRRHGPLAGSDAPWVEDRVLRALDVLLVVLVPWALCPLARDDGLAEEGRLGARDLPGAAWLLLRLDEPVGSLLEVVLVVLEGTGAVSGREESSEGREHLLNLRHRMELLISESVPFLCSLLLAEA